MTDRIVTNLISRDEYETSQRAVSQCLSPMSPFLPPQLPGFCNTIVHELVMYLRRHLPSPTIMLIRGTPAHFISTFRLSVLLLPELHIYCFAFFYQSIMSFLLLLPLRMDSLNFYSNPNSVFPLRSISFLTTPYPLLLLHLPSLLLHPHQHLISLTYTPTHIFPLLTHYCFSSIAMPHPHSFSP